MTSSNDSKTSPTAPNSKPGDKKGKNGSQSPAFSLNPLFPVSGFQAVVLNAALIEGFADTPAAIIVLQDTLTCLMRFGPHEPKEFPCFTDDKREDSIKFFNAVASTALVTSFKSDTPVTKDDLLALTDFLGYQDWKKQDTGNKLSISLAIMYLLRTQPIEVGKILQALQVIKTDSERKPPMA